MGVTCSRCLRGVRPGSTPQHAVERTHGKTGSRRALRARADSRRGRRGRPVLQGPVLGAADGERRNCPGVRGVLSKVPERCSCSCRRTTFGLSLRMCQPATGTSAARPSPRSARTHRNEGRAPSTSLIAPTTRVEISSFCWGDRPSMKRMFTSGMVPQKLWVMRCVHHLKVDCYLKATASTQSTSR